MTFFRKIVTNRRGKDDILDHFNKCIKITKLKHKNDIMFITIIIIAVDK